MTAEFEQEEIYVNGEPEMQDTTELHKKITFDPQSYLYSSTYAEAELTNVTNQRILSFHSFRSDIDISANFDATTVDPKKAEPFYKYDLYVYGKKYTVPYYMINDIHLLIAINSGVINYLIYFNEKRNIIASGSFTHSIKYQIDGLDAFYSQNPTYKDQFFTKMATDSIKTVVGGAIGGAAIGPLGVAAGATLGVAAATVDAGLSLINLNYQEKSLEMKPDQLFGENSEVSLQWLNIFGIYWVKKTPENIDLMLTEYGLRGFPTSLLISISNLDYSVSIFGSSKVIYGEIKKVIKNEYTTGFINLKLKEGVVFVE
jgi:glutaredoxin